MTWVLIVSWHAVRTASRVPGRWITVCGLTSYSDPVDVLPAGRSCERCLRVLAKKADA